MTLYAYDATHADVSSIPGNAPVVMGYVTGTPDIKWTSLDYKRFPHADLLFVDQGVGAVPWSRPNVIDVESGAHTPQDIIPWAAKYGGKGWPLAVYCMQSNLQAVHATWRGPVIIAAPSYPTDQEARDLAASLNLKYPGLDIVMVQDVWTPQNDRSVVLKTWWVPTLLPAPKPAPKPVPVPKPVTRPTVNILGHELQQPYGDTVPCVIGWYGDTGATNRVADIPAALWQQVHAHFLP